MVNEDVKNQPSSLNEMREARRGHTVAFKIFTENYKNFKSHVFCFYEGEDGKYYNQKIYTTIGTNIIPILCGNKSKTLKTWRLIKANAHYKEVNKMFFVDHDMDEIPVDKDKDLYVTPCYSIENLYANKETFENILQSEFSLNRIDRDFKLCCEAFDSLFTQFNQEMIEFNALVLIRKNKNLGNGKVSLQHIKISHLVSIELTGISKSSKYNEKVDDLKSKLSASKAELSTSVDKILSVGDFANRFRGKNQLDFFVTLIRKFKDAHESSRFFTEKRRCVNINLTDNRLSELSQYAVFPRCLREFIEIHKIA